MRRLTSLVTACCLAAGSLAAQGLGEAAAREKRRREEEQKKNKGPAKVITTDDLAKVQAVTATASSPPQSQETGGRRSSDATSPDEPDPVGRERVKRPAPEGAPPELGGQDEKAWRAQAAEKRAQIQAAEAKLKPIEAEVGQLFGEIQRSTDTHEILRLRARQDELAEQLKAAQRELADLKEELAQFEESARRSGVPPGWIR